MSPGKGVRWVPDPEKIRRYRRVPLIDRLRWLWEAKVFLHGAMPKRNWEIMQEFRRGGRGTGTDTGAPPSPDRGSGWFGRETDPPKATEGREEG